MYVKQIVQKAFAVLWVNMLCLAAFAQERSITGTVVDEANEPIIGANITELGTTNGVITDLDGNFTLKVQADAKIQISFIGYIMQTVAVGNRTHFDIVLKEDTKTLDEVVVVGYGTMKKAI